MANPKPYGGSSAQRLTAMINRDNQGSLQLGIHFTFGEPSEFLDEYGRNTQVTMTPVPGTHFRGPETIYYKRMSLDVLANLPGGFVQPVLVPRGPIYIHDILPRINAALGVDLEPEEVVDEYFEEELDVYPLRIVNSASLAWVESGFTFAIEREPDSPTIPLLAAIPTNLLSGLQYQEAT